MRSGSSGATALCSAIRCSLLFAPCSCEELTQVLHLLQPLLRCHGQDTGHIVQHVRPGHHAGLNLGAHLKRRRGKQTLERFPGGACLTRLDPSDHGLSGTGPARQGALAETRASTSLTEQGAGSTEQKEAPERTAPCSLLLFATISVLAFGPSIASTQQPTVSQVQQALQQQSGLGDMVRTRIAQSGLSADQIRARLVAGGYPATLLDAYMGSNAAPSAPGAQELAAIQALGMPAINTALISPDTGIVRAAGGAPSDVFGVDVFRRTTTQFLPLLSGPVPPDYKVGPGDDLVLILTGEVELTYELSITREGFILIPQVGQVYVANLTLDQLRNVLQTRLSRAYSGLRGGAKATIRFDVSVANVRANQVYVVGEVAQPGAYQISSLGTVFTGLYAAGGVTERAKLRGLEVQRLGKTIATLDLYDYLLRGDTRSDIRLETGDVIFVPIHESRVRITGAVLRPAVYELKDGETLVDLVKAAGGFRPDAALERVKVQRVRPANERGAQTTARVTIDVPLIGNEPPRFVLEDGDVVQVDSLLSAAD